MLDVCTEYGAKPDVYLHSLGVAAPDAGAERLSVLNRLGEMRSMCGWSGWELFHMNLMPEIELASWQLTFVLSCSFVAKYYQ